MMEDGNGRKKVWICLSIVVLAAVVIGAVYYMNMPCLLYTSPSPRD